MTAPETLTAAVRRHAATRTAAPALVDGDDGTVTTYGELLTEPTDGAPELSFVLMRETVPHVVTYIRLLDLPGAVAVIDPATPAERFHELLERYVPDAVYGTEVDLETLGLVGGPAERPVPLPRARFTVSSDGEIHPDLQLLLSTSGSTGSPKFVRLSARNVAANATGIADALDIAAADRAITCLPLHYTYGLSILHSHLAVGAAVICAEPALLTPRFWQTFRDLGATTLAGVPFSYRIYDRLRLLDDPPASLQVMTQAGGKLDPVTVQRYATELASRGRRFYVMYGQTEATARMSVLPHGLAAAHPDTVGFPLPEGRFEIDQSDAAGGEVVYSGPNVMLGYATGRADLARGDEMGGVLRTGDVGHVTAEGLLRITGRLKRIAKLSGVRVSLDDVEAAASRFVRAAALAGDDRITLVVEGEVTDDRSLRREVAHAAGLVARDLEVVVVDELPCNSSGKIDYARLEASL